MQKAGRGTQKVSRKCKVIVCFADPTQSKKVVFLVTSVPSNPAYHINEARNGRVIETTSAACVLQPTRYLPVRARCPAFR